MKPTDKNHPHHEVYVVLDVLQDLNYSVEIAGGCSLSIKTLKEMSALDFIVMLAANGVSFTNVDKE